MTDYEGLILARQDLYEILDDVGGDLCCENCAECVFQDLCLYREDAGREKEDD